MWEYFYSSLLDKYVLEKPDWSICPNGTYPISPKEYLKQLKDWIDTSAIINKSSASQEIEDAERALSISFENLPHYKYFFS